MLKKSFLKFCHKNKQIGHVFNYILSGLCIKKYVILILFRWGGNVDFPNEFPYSRLLCAFLKEPTSEIKVVIKMFKPRQIGQHRARMIHFTSICLKELFYLPVHNSMFQVLRYVIFDTWIRRNFTNSTYLPT